MQVKFTQQERQDILCTAAEGGINYWIQGESNSYQVERDGYEYLRIDVWDDNATGGEIGGFGFVDARHDSLDMAANLVLSGEINAPYTKKQLEDSAARKDLDLDAEAADVLVQIVIFGKIIYG